METVAAIVVTYFPDAPRLAGLIQNLQHQVAQVLLVDNTPAGSQQVVKELAQQASGRGVAITLLGENRGIAAAQNEGIQQARELGFSHVVLFDQDSSPATNFVSGLMGAHSRLTAQGANVAAVGPVFVDTKSGKRSPAIRVGRWGLEYTAVDDGIRAPVPTDYLIASGSLIALDVVSAVGPMREELFIDWVDIEWCLRAKGLGFQSYLVPQVMMDHSVGDAVVTVLGRQIDLHSDLRNCYMVRNAAFLLRDSRLPRAWRWSVLLRLPAFVAVYSWHSLSRSPWRAMRRLLRACAEGFRGEVGQIKNA